jgi:hypothetical protein
LPAGPGYKLRAPADCLPGAEAPVPKPERQEPEIPAEVLDETQDVDDGDRVTSSDEPDTGEDTAASSRGGKGKRARGRKARRGIVRNTTLHCSIGTA